MRCKQCHYDLRQLSESRCPECGRAFDPDDARTFDSIGGRRQRMSRLLALGGSWLAGTLAFLACLKIPVECHAITSSAPLQLTFYAVVVVSLMWALQALDRLTRGNKPG